MLDFVDDNPIIVSEEIAEFTGIDDILTKYLNETSNITGGAIYKVDGSCISKKFKNKTI